MFQPFDSTFENLHVALGNNRNRNGVNQHGPEAYLANLCEQYMPNDEFFFVKYAQGATAIREHFPETIHFDSLYEGNLKPAVEKLMGQGYQIFLTIFIDQGESDTDTQAEADQYALNLDTLTNAWWDSTTYDAPYIMREINNETTCCRTTVNEALKHRSKVKPNFYVASRADLTNQDASHLDYESVKLLSEKWFSIWLNTNRGGFIQDSLPVVEVLPVSDFDNEPIPVYQGLELDSTLNLAANHIIRLDLTNYTSPMSLAFIGAKDGGRYTISWTNNTNTTPLTFPTNLFCNDGIAEGNFAPASNEAGTMDFYYDGLNYYITSSAPNCITTFEQEYQLVLDHYSSNGITLPPDSLQGFQNTAVRKIKAQGIWDKLDVVYFPATSNQRQAVTNFKNPTQDSIEIIQSPTFTANRGFRSELNNGYLRLTFLPINGLTNFKEAEAGIYYFIADSSLVQNNTAYFLQDTTLGRIRIVNNASGNTAGFGLSQLSFDTSPRPTGFFGISHTGFLGTDHYFYHNGVEQPFTFQNGNNIYASEPKMLFQNGESLSFLALGGNLSAAEHLALYQIMQEYFDAINLVAQ